jgi:hypothetical protein
MAVTKGYLVLMKQALSSIWVVFCFGYYMDPYQATLSSGPLLGAIIITITIDNLV